MNKLGFLIILLFTGIVSHAQLNIGGKPMSFSNDIASQIKAKMPTFTMPSIDLDKIKVNCDFITIKNAGHCFDEEGVELKLFEETLVWFENNN